MPAAVSQSVRRHGHQEVLVSFISDGAHCSVISDDPRQRILSQFKSLGCKSLLVNSIDNAIILAAGSWAVRLSSQVIIITKAFLTEHLNRTVLKWSDARSRCKKCRRTSPSGTPYYYTARISLSGVRFVVNYSAQTVAENGDGLGENRILKEENERLRRKFSDCEVVNWFSHAIAPHHCNFALRGSSKVSWGFRL